MPRLGLSCPDRVLRPGPGTTRLGHERTTELSGPMSRQGSLCHDRVPRHAGRFWVVTEILASCRDRVLGWDRVFGATRIPLCRDKVFLRLGHSYRDPQTRPARATECGRTHDRSEHAHERAHQLRCYACDRADRACAQLRARRTCTVANSALCCTLFELLFMDIVNRYCSWTL